MEKIESRFLRYVAVDTQSKEEVEAVPSTEKQHDLAKILCEELKAMGYEAKHDAHCYVYGTSPGNCPEAPVIGLSAHMDTSPDASGADHVTFLFSANRNVPPQDVSEIASGGEIARLMLSIKALISRRTHLPSIIFDEIDTGVSGHVAERMAQMMRRIAESCQVICITHLPQIAASGEHHFRVFKADDADGMTRSHIIPLDEEERIREIAHMLSGAQLTEAAIENARTLCNSAHNA